MILNDSEIVRRMEYAGPDRRIEVEPEPSDTQIQPASLDFHIGDTMLSPKTGEEIDLTEDPDNQITLAPGAFLLGETEESLTLPNDLTALITGRSTYGRKGLTTHVTAGFVDPGWSGRLTLEIKNVSNSTVSVEAGERIGQFVFVECVGESSGYQGKYAGADGPEAAKEDEP